MAMLIELQGQEQVLRVDTHRQGAPIEAQFLLLALYISRAINGSKYDQHPNLAAL